MEKGSRRIRGALLSASFLLASLGGLSLLRPHEGAGGITLEAAFAGTSRLPEPAFRETPRPFGLPAGVPFPAPPLARTEGKVAAEVPPHVEPPVPAAAVQDRLIAYRGLGMWVDLFDFGNPGQPRPSQMVDEMARRGVKTLFLQTARWNTADIVDPGATAEFIEASHARGMRVVAWYLPGFADIDRDLRGSLAAITFRTPSGQGFDGFAPDIEDARAVGGDRARFNRGIAEYSRRLREVVGPHAVLGGIVVDAKNNTRAPGAWAGFPWREIAEYYDVVLPMSYWTVVKPKDCHSHDAVSYMREVAALTTQLMEKARPLHLIGGIADCIQVDEVSGYVDVLKEVGSIGGGLYDFATTVARADSDAVWGLLARLNE